MILVLECKQFRARWRSGNRFIRASREQEVSNLPQTVNRGISHAWGPLASGVFSSQIWGFLIKEIGGAVDCSSRELCLSDWVKLSKCLSWGYRAEGSFLMENLITKALIISIRSKDLPGKL